MKKILFLTIILLLGCNSKNENSTQNVHQSNKENILKGLKFAQSIVQFDNYMSQM